MSQPHHPLPPPRQLQWGRPPLPMPVWLQRKDGRQRCQRLFDKSCLKSHA